ncbi:MAG: pentapeptide repeat-containing protein [Deltaproteobacteria bacterium]
MPTTSRAISIGAASEYENQAFGREASLPPRLECVDFTDCSFVGLEFRSVRLLSCRFFDCRFERVDASAADFTDCTFRGTTFVDSKFLGINWTILRALQTPRWERCLLDGGCFQALPLEAAEWMESRLVEVDFSECNLQRAKFHGSALEGANFSGANLMCADFTRTTGLQLDPRHTRLGQTLLEMDAVLRMATALGVKIVGT